MLKLLLDKESDTPIYRQIIEQVTRLIRKGSLRAGDKLPPERELAGELNIARGTIKKAYAELERNKVIEVIQGSGSFVSGKQDVLEKGRKEEAVKIIDDALASLENLRFTYREIETLLHVRMLDRQKLPEKVRIAGIDCNPEALSIFKHQLSYISNVEFSKFLLEDIGKYTNPEDRFRGFDLLITTSTHYNEVCKMLPGLSSKIIQAAVSPSQQTIIDIATIPTGAGIGVICSSRQFLNIIKRSLKNLGIDIKGVSCLFESENIDPAKFLASRKILIIPPESSLEDEPQFKEAAADFGKRGGRVIRFEYQMERGSMIYIDEQVSNIMNKK